jgi:hypothetical protein
MSRFPPGYIQKQKTGQRRPFRQHELPSANPHFSSGGENRSARFSETFVTATIRRQATRPANGVCASASALKALTLGFYISKAMLG